MKVKPETAALLSRIIPGAGQVYKGEFLKGLIFFATSPLIFPYFLSIFDAYLDSEKDTKEKLVEIIKLSA